MSLFQNYFQLIFFNSLEIRFLNAPVVMPKHFDPHQPFPDMVALAQAKVFNDHSWDMWTQMWHAQMEPISNYPDWVAMMTATNQDAMVAANQSPAQFAEVEQYLKNTQQLAPVAMSH